MVLLGRIELPTSSLPMTRSTTELQQPSDKARPIVVRPSNVNVLVALSLRYMSVLVALSLRYMSVLVALSLRYMSARLDVGASNLQGVSHE